MDFADAYLMCKLGHPELAGWWGKLLGGGSGGGGGADRVYGVEWDYSNPSPALTRTGNAANFADPVPATSLAGTGSSPFDRIMPWAGMRMCNIIGGEVAYWQGDPQFSETDYDTMVFIPEFWYKAEKNASASKWNWSISPSEKEGYSKHPGSGRYIGRFHSTGGSDGVYSKSDAMPMHSTTDANMRQYSHNKGAHWWMLDLATWSAVQLLYLIEFANFNSQALLGGGQNGGSLTETGGTSGAVYHTLKRSGASNQYRWVEDPFSNLHDTVDGFVAVDRLVYAGLNNADFDGSPSALARTGITLPTTSGSTGGDIRGFGYSAVCPFAFIPDVATGKDYTIYVTDRIVTGTGTMYLSVGGNMTSSDDFGMFRYQANSNSSYVATGKGSRLIFIP